MVLRFGKRLGSHCFAKSVSCLLLFGLGGVSGVQAATANLTYQTGYPGIYQLDDAVTMSGSNSVWTKATLQQDINGDGNWTDLSTNTPNLWGPGTFHTYFAVGNNTGAAQIVKCRNEGAIRNFSYDGGTLLWTPTKSQFPHDR